MSLFGQNQQQQQQTPGGGFGASTGFGQQPNQGFGGATTGFGGQQTQGFIGSVGFGQQPNQGFGGASSGFQQQQSSSFGGGQIGGGMTQQPNYQMDENEVDVPHPFKDSISDMKSKQIGPGQCYMALSCWDGGLMLYQIQAQLSQSNQQYHMGAQQENKKLPPQVSPLTQQPTMTGGPILGICWMAEMNPGMTQNMVLFIAHSDGTIKRWDPQQQGVAPQTVGQHDGPVKDVYSFCLNNVFFLVSGGFDGMVKFWQINGQQLQQVGQSWLGKPIQIMSGAFPILVTAHSERYIHLWNLNNILQQKFDPITFRMSPLKWATSSLCAFADGKGYAVGSIEGRCGIVNVDLSNPDAEDQRDFCFKCHRVENQQNKDGDVWTVNHISFNKQHNTFATSGSDGSFIIWNKDTKSRYKSSNKASLPMTVANFSDDATILAFATGEDWSLGGTAAKMRQNVVKFYVRQCEKEDVFKQKK